MFRGVLSDSLSSVFDENRFALFKIEEEPNWQQLLIGGSVSPIKDSGFSSYPDHFSASEALKILYLTSD